MPNGAEGYYRLTCICIHDRKYLSTSPLPAQPCANSSIEDVHSKVDSTSTNDPYSRDLSLNLKLGSSSFSWTKKYDFCLRNSDTDKLQSLSFKMSLKHLVNDSPEPSNEHEHPLGLSWLGIGSHQRQVVSLHGMNEERTRYRANCGTFISHNGEWKSIESGLQGLLNGEAILPDDISSSHHSEDYGLIDYNFEGGMEAVFLQLDSSDQLIPNNYLTAPELPSNSQSPDTAAENGPDYIADAQRTPSQINMESETVCYGMVSVNL